MDLQKRVREHYDFICNKYGEDNVFFVTLYGSQNYGLDTPMSDVDTKAVIFLPGDDLIWGECLSVEEHLENDEHCEVKDLVTFCKCLAKQNLNFLEVFATKAIVINPKYRKSFEEFQKVGELMVRYDIHKLVCSCGSQGRHHFRQFSENPNNRTKQLVNAYRLAAYCRDMANGLPFDRCVQFHDKNKEEILNIKTTGEYSMDFVESTLSLLNDVTQFEIDTRGIPRNEYAYNYMRGFCVQIYRKRLNFETW